MTKYQKADHEKPRHAYEWRTLTMRRLSQATPDPLRAHGTRYNRLGYNAPHGR